MTKKTWGGSTLESINLEKGGVGSNCQTSGIVVSDLSLANVYLFSYEGVRQLFEWVRTQGKRKKRRWLDNPICSNTQRFEDSRPVCCRQVHRVPQNWLSLITSIQLINSWEHLHRTVTILSEEDGAGSHGRATCEEKVMRLANLINPGKMAKVLLRDKGMSHK